jgi:hypothetical protein
MTLPSIAHMSEGTDLLTYTVHTHLYAVGVRTAVATFRCNMRLIIIQSIFAVAASFRLGEVNDNLQSTTERCITAFASTIQS